MLIPATGAASARSAQSVFSTPWRKVRGFTLIELMIVVAIIAIVAVLGVPGMQDWMQNNRIMATARSIQSGLVTARAEAIRRNTRVSFVLTNPGAAGNANWCILLSSVNFDCNTPAPARLTQTMAEGATNVEVNVTPNGAQAVTFDGTGRVCNVARGCTDPYTQVDIGIPTMNADDSRDVRITIDVGGAVRICIPDLGDNAPIPPAGDPKRCA